MSSAAAVLLGPLGRDPWIVRWMIAHPRIIDGIVVLASSGLQRVALILTGEPVNWIASLALAAAAVALFWRRRFPFAVLLVVTAIASAGLLVSPGLAYQGLPSAFALYAVAVNRNTGTAALGYAVAVGLPTLTGLVISIGQPAPFSPGILDPLALLALALGIAVRAKRERREALATLIQQRADHAALTERARITAEMHDVVAHSITVMIALAGGARSGWSTHPERAREALDHLNDVGANALSEMQRILHVLRAEDSDLDRALHASGHNVRSLEELAEVFRAAGLPVTLSRRGAVPDADPALRTTIHRIVQEALTNALRYAQGATAVRVEVTRTASSLEVTITDDGRAGPDQPSAGAGVGLTSIRERAAAFGGSSTAGPLDDGGWRIRASIPIPPGGET